jgi:hypothetical protein
VGVVKADKPLPVGVVQREGVAQSWGRFGVGSTRAISNFLSQTRWCTRPSNATRYGTPSNSVIS